MTRILVTGASGFVGRALTPELAHKVDKVRIALRTLSASVGLVGEPFVVGSIDENTEWSGALAGVDVVVHLAGRRQLGSDHLADPLAEFRRDNVAGTERLAIAASQASVRRFVYLSTIKVNGEQTCDLPFCEKDTPDPQDAYAISKWEAELTLHRLVCGTGMELVVLRPPLVYGPGVGGTFQRLMNLSARGWPLPLASIDNRRSLIYVGNLVHAIIHCLDHPAAAGETFLVSDDQDMSTPELIKKLSRCMGRTAHLAPFPPSLLRNLAALVGREHEAARLVDSLQINPSKIQKRLGWVRPFGVDEGLLATVQAYLADVGRHAHHR